MSFPCKFTSQSVTQSAVLQNLLRKGRTFSKGWIVPAGRHVHIFKENVLPKSLMMAFQKKERKKNQLQLQTQIRL